MGHMAYERWTSTTSDNRCSELAINPNYIAKYPIKEIFQTIVHEQCHLWQDLFGKPSQKSYHNKEWASKMESLGLMPSNTGQPGGKRTGQKMSDYAIEGGLFEQVCKELIKSFSLEWLDRVQHDPKKSQEVTSEDMLAQSISTLYPEVLFMEAQTVKGAQSKIKYTCQCKQNIWGKPGLNATCNLCGGVFERQD